MSNIKITNIPINKTLPNNWNPNRQSNKQYQAEIESIVKNGFIMPIIVRDLETHYEIIDGEHRWHALNEIIENKIKGNYNIPHLSETKTIPAVIIEADDLSAKKLTITMNEVRGYANIDELSDLLKDLNKDLNFEELSYALPYYKDELEQLLHISELTIEERIEEEGNKFSKITFYLSKETMVKWNELLQKDNSKDKKNIKKRNSDLLTTIVNHYIKTKEEK